MTENNEQEKKEETKGVEQETPTSNSDVGKHEINVIETAKKIHEGMKEENDRKAKLLDREEKLFAKQEALRALGGGSPVGQNQEKPKEETAKEYADRILNGKK